MDHYHNLELFIDADPSDPNTQPFIDAYQKHINAHNEKNQQSHPYEDSGFDLLVPSLSDNTITKDNHYQFKIDHKIIAVMHSPQNRPTGFTMHPRSSLGSKTPFRLANSTGIIDSGYRGHIISVFDINPQFFSTNTQSFIINPNDKFVQICAPDLSPIHVTLTNSHPKLHETHRGTGGFGSTSS
tara:strand:+ start:454 stop:1005 length:552 start_codon:yes stop_codon:yes gene_type:complete